MAISLDNFFIFTYRDYLNGDELKNTVENLVKKSKTKMNTKLFVFHSHLNMDTIKILANSSFFIGVTEINFESYCQIDSLQPLIDSKNFSNLTKLSLRSCQNLIVQEIKELLHSQALTHLKELNLSNTLINDEVLTCIGDSKYLRNLNSLNIGSCFKLSDELAFKNLFSSENMHNITDLFLTNLPIIDDILLLLSSSKHLISLENLDLGFCSLLTDIGVESLFSSDIFPDLKTLSLENTKITARLFKSITKLNIVGSLRSFNLHECFNISPEGFEELFLNGGSFLENLENLAISLTKVDSKGVDALANNPKIKKLKSLKLFDVPKISQDSMQKLFLSPVMANIVNLDLTIQTINNTLLEVLATSPYLNNIEDLCLAGCTPVESKGINFFLNSQNSLKLIVLNLQMTSIDSEFIIEIKRLIINNRLPLMKVLNVRKCRSLSHQNTLDLFLFARKYGILVCTEYGFE